MGTADVGAVVVGAGISGLAAALELQQTTSEVVLVDASDRPGGVLRTDHVAGFVVERGPNTFRVSAPLLEALRGLRLDDEILRARPASRLRYLLRGGELVALPLSPIALARSDLISRRGKLRLLAEPFVRRGDGADESVAEFVRRRLGSEVLTRLVGPSLTGLYAGDEEQLGAETVFKSLVQHERRHRSIAFGALARALSRRRPRGLPGSWSAPKGLGPFARALTRRLVDPPALQTRALELVWLGTRWRVSLTGPAGETALLSRRVVIATPAREAARLLLDVDTEVSRLLEGIEYAPLVSLPIGVDPRAVRRKIEGFGFLVPREEGVALLGCLFMSRLFPDRAPLGRELLQCMFGGRRWPAAVAEPADALFARALADLDRALGISGQPLQLGLARHERAVPQPGRDHGRRIAELRRRLATRPGLVLAGAYLDGVSVADCFASGQRAARDLVADERLAAPRLEDVAMA
jgi:protoporphyrinogen/coproporphyrinogen III oxidase